MKVQRDSQRLVTKTHTLHANKHSTLLPYPHRQEIRQTCSSSRCPRFFDLTHDAHRYLILVRQTHTLHAYRHPFSPTCMQATEISKVSLVLDCDKMISIPHARMASSHTAHSTDPFRPTCKEMIEVDEVFALKEEPHP